MQGLQLRPNLRNVISPYHKPKAKSPLDVLNILARIPQQSLVHVKYGNQTYEGILRLKLKDGSKISLADGLQLIHGRELNSQQIPSLLRFIIGDVDDVRLIRPPLKYDNKNRKASKEPKGAPERFNAKWDADAPVEIMFSTFKVTDDVELKAVAELLREVDKVGVAFCGENVGRHGLVTWIILAAGKTLIPLDIAALSLRTNRLWEILNRRIFSNDRLMKIMHDCRPAADYLLHVHNIQMANVFDTQIADALIVCEATGQAPTNRRSLSECLTTYVSKIPHFEIDHLKKSEELFDFKVNSAWLSRNPDARLLKYGAIQVKHLIPLQENLVKKMLTKFAKCVQHSVDSVNLPEYSFAESIKDPLEISAELRDLLEGDGDEDDSIVDTGNDSTLSNT